MSQSNEILGWMQKGKPITPMDALREFGCFRLAARIKDLRDSGYLVNTTLIKKNGKQIAKYSL